MLHQLLRIFSLLFWFVPATAQLPYQLQGARIAGMGGAAVPVTNVWALHYNIGALAEVQQPQLATAYQTRLNLPELSTAAVLASIPLPLGVAGASCSRYGFGAHHITEGTIGFAHKIQLVSLGLQGGFVQMATQGFGSQLVPVLSLGGTAQLLPSLRFGGSVYNIIQSTFKQETEEHLPTLLRAGLLWQPREEVLLVVETEKDVDYKARFKAGIEYKIHRVVALRGGFSSRASSLHAGLGFHPDKFLFDYALQHHQHMGLMHHISFGLLIGKEK